MALTKKEVEEKYISKLHIYFKECEQGIDDYLVNNYETIRKDEIICISNHVVFRGLVPTNFENDVVLLIKEKYSDWKVSYDLGEGFVFRYKTGDQSLLSLYGSMESRFELLDIREDDDICDAGESDSSKDDIPF